jgi:nitronate monooxygenase/enoyl-[acyl-carrier protein] reductase II
MSMMDILGISVPIVQAPIGSACTPELAGAVSNAGGLGSLALTWQSRAGAVDLIARTRGLTDNPFAVNFVLEFDVGALLADVLDAGVRIVSTFWGDPAPVRPLLERFDAIHIHVVGSLNEARWAADLGVDVIVAQGWEAGGHVRGTTSTLCLVPAVVDAVAPVPVLAAGGISDGRGLAAALSLGAQGAWVGTRFLAALEAATHGHYRHRLVEADPDDAVHTTCFDGGWSGAAHRSLRNRTLEVWERAGKPRSPNRPGEGETVATRGDTSYTRYGDSVPLVDMVGDLDDMALYAGQGVGVIDRVDPVADILADMIAEAQRALDSARQFHR